MTGKGIAGERKLIVWRGGYLPSAQWKHVGSHSSEKCGGGGVVTCVGATDIKTGREFGRKRERVVKGLSAGSGERADKRRIIVRIAKLLDRFRRGEKATEGREDDTGASRGAGSACVANDDHTKSFGVGCVSREDSGGEKNTRGPLRGGTTTHEEGGGEPLYETLKVEVRGRGSGWLRRKGRRLKGGKRGGETSK